MDQIIISMEQWEYFLNFVKKQRQWQNKKFSIRNPYHF